MSVPRLNTDNLQRKYVTSRIIQGCPVFFVFFLLSDTCMARHVSTERDAPPVNASPGQVIHAENISLSGQASGMKGKQGWKKRRRKRDRVNVRKDKLREEVTSVRCDWEQGLAEVETSRRDRLAERQAVCQWRFERSLPKKKVYYFKEFLSIILFCLRFWKTEGISKSQQ